MSAPPSFLQSLPTETDATDGDIVTFQVKVSSDPGDPATVSWWRCGEPLRPAPGRRDMVSHGDGWHELVLANITEEDEGEYECRAENGRGHNSCFGSLYYYREGGAGTLTDVTMEGTAEEGDGRRSGLLILIDDGSQTEESGSEKSNRKSMTVSEQMQGIIEDLTQSSQGENTGSMTLERDDDEDQFNSDVDDQHLLQSVLGQKTASEDTLVPEMPSPDLVPDAAISEGAADPYGSTTASQRPHRWSSNPNDVHRKKRKKEQVDEEECVWPPPEAFELPADTATTSVELPPFAKGTVTSTTEEGAVKTGGAETPFDVADITEEEAVDIGGGSFRCSPLEGSTTADRTTPGSSPKAAPAFRHTPQRRADSSLTSVTDFSVAAEVCQHQSDSRMSFVKSSIKHTDEGMTVSSSAVESTSVHQRSVKLTRRAEVMEEEEISTKRSKVSSAYEADESTLYSESCLTPSEHKGGAEVYVAIMDFRPMESDEEAVAMREGQQVEVIDASKPRRWLVRVLPLEEGDPNQEGWVPACYLEKSTAWDTLGGSYEPQPLHPREAEALHNREAIVKELVETEEDFAKDMAFVVENYYRQMDNPRLPKELRDRKGSVFGNFKDISDFHNNVLMEGIHYHAKEPTKLGKTFLRLERDFDMHANYCWNEARAQQLLREGPLREYFDEHSRTLDDEKLLSDHLKLPIQRLNDYQLLLKELIKYSGRLGEETADLEKALDFIHGINKRTKDLHTIQAIDGCRGDLLKIGKILRHEVLEVPGEGDRDVFLFKGRLFVTERRMDAADETRYHVTHLFKLQEVELVESDPTSIVFRSQKRGRPGFPLALRTRSPEQKANWCRDIDSANQVVEDLGELEPCLEGSVELKHKPEEAKEEPDSKKPKVESSLQQHQEPSVPAEEVVTEPPKQESKKKKEDDPKPPKQEKTQEEGKKREIDLMDKPRFSKTLRGVTCAPGEKAALECETEGSPTPSVTWLKDNQKIAKSPRVKASSKGQVHTLTIEEAGSEDGGLYTVVASSTQGTASCSAPLNLKIPLLGVPKEDSRPTTPGGTVLPHAPVFKVKLNKETQLLEGTSVRFELVVRGNPEPKVKFLKDGKELKLDDRVRVSYESKEVFELILDHVGPKDAGTYSCVASNSEGEDTTTGTLSVVKTKDVFKGLEDTLEEEREPTPRPKTPKFKWFKDGQYFEANERFQVIFNEEEDSLALMFQHVTPEDAGLYTCVASTSSGSKIACSAELTVQGVLRQVEAPGIKAQLSDVEATEGGSAMLELKITGYPKPKVTWYHKNKEVLTGGRYRFLFADEESFTLVIKNVKKDDGGKYTVKASNEMGEAESSCTLSVKSAPCFTKGLKDMSVMSEETIKFEAQIDGNPAPEVKWYKDGQQLNASNRIKIANDKGKASLHIVEAKLTDSGSYSCVLTNSIGSQAEFSNVVVKASPTFSKGMENVEGLEGDTLQFSVEVNGNPKPTTKWTKDGKELVVDGKHIRVVEEAPNCYTLVVDKATLADVGVYTCELRNEHGLKASSGNLNLKTKPEFIKKLSDSECKEGEGITLTTSVKGYPCPLIKWYFGECELKDDKSYNIVSGKDGTHSLKVKKASRSMSGQYTCKATNELGETATSGTVAVIVTKKKPEIDQQLKPTQLVESKPGKIVGKVSGEPKPKIQLLKDGKPVPRDGHFSIEESEDGTVALLIDKVVAGDAGLYCIVALNEDGEARFEAPVTTIPAGKKPEFIKELDNLELIECQPLKLQAKVIGKPTSVKWQKDGGEDLLPSDRIKIVEEADGTVALSIDCVNQKDSGKYAVIASNAEGKARTTSLVQVQAVKEPEIVSSLEPLSLKDGETGQLNVKITGEPKPTVRWFKDGRELNSSNRVESVEGPDGTFSLVIRNARPEDAGNYSIAAQNLKGEAKSSAPVTVTQAPTFLKPLGLVSVVEGFPAKLEAKLSGCPPPEISWLKDGKPITPDGIHIKELRNPDGSIGLLLDTCNLEDAGRYSLVAKNMFGEDTSSGNLDVSGKEAYGSPKCAPCVVTPLRNLCVKEGEPIRFETEVSGNPLPDIVWTVNDKDLEPSDNTLMTFDGKKAILEIKRSSPDHIGLYKCKLSNHLGSAATEGSVVVQEKAAPHFIQRLSDFNGFINQPMKLSCKLTGYPEPEIDWHFNGNLLNTNNPRYNYTHFGDTHTLTIPAAQVEDCGTYECKATNSVGEDNTRAAVNISDKVEKGEPPMFLKKIGDNEVMEGMTAKFTACVTGIPTPDVSWVKEGSLLEPSSRHKMELESTGILRLIIREVEPSDYGNYSVTISNIHGSATSSAKLCPDSLDEKYITPIGDQFVGFDKFRKTGAPVPLPEKPRIIRMDDTSLTLGWKPSVPNAPRLPVTYQLEMASHPEGDWTPYKIGLKDTLCDVQDLRPGSDYKFRIRVENKHGVSEPSPYTTAHRSKIYEPPKPQDFQPKDYEIEHPPLQKYAAPPRFVRKEDDTMYGVRGQPVTIEFWVYGHPEPQVTWFKGESQIGKEKYTFMQDRNGKLSVFIDCMSDDYVGMYTCVAVNDEGESSMKIKLLIAEPPVFLQRLDETTSMSRRSGRMQCRMTGLPYPKIKWFRDWHPLYESERIKILWEEPDKSTLFISNLITRDHALYSCTATNIAGIVTSSAILNVEDVEESFDAKTYCRPIPVRSRTKPFEDFYDIGDELGRGTQGIAYHAVKRETGDVYVAKTMHGQGKFKDFMKAEMEIMNQMCHPKLVRLRDAFEAQDTLTLVADICGGVELLGSILKRGGVSEREVANYIRQILEGLEYMHSRYIGHLGLTIGDVMVARVNSYDIKIGDFGLAARLLPGKDYFLEYGHPEFVAPEVANKQAVTVLADMWSVGVITYLLLSGISPFLGEHDRETLTRVQLGKINFVEEAFVGVSDDAKDFMSKLLVFDPKGRMDVKTALNHKWLKFYNDKAFESKQKLNNLDRLKEYQNKWKEWYNNASCKRYYRRNTLESCFHHPSKMIYPPGESYTPPTTPQPTFDRSHVKPLHFDDTFKQKINREEIDFRSESSYQNGPDTYLLQLRDTNFPLRLREYLRVGASTSPSLAANLRDTHWGDSTLVIRERRKFVDMMDEEIDDEKKGLVCTSVPRRIYHEVGTLGFAREQMEQLKKDVWKDKGSREVEIGMVPYFREKIRDMSMKEGDEVVFRCYAIGKPKVDYSWFRNDGILLESSRVVVKELKDGHVELRINPSRAYDVGVYKCVARNMHGTTCCRARLRLGSKPGRPEPPILKDCSDTEMYITWAVPRDEGQSTTLGYTLEYKQADAEEWSIISCNIEHEYFVVRNLLPTTFYQFRVKAYNKFGWGEPGFPTAPLSTKAEGAPKVKVSPRRKYQQEFTERTPEYELLEIELPDLDYSQETNPVPIVEGETLDLYRIVSEMDRGRFSVVLNVWVKESNESNVAKVIQTTDYADGRTEYEIMKSLCHEKIVTLLAASYKGDKTVLVLEKLSGVDVMSYLALRHDYNEEMVVTIIKQVLEALQYLHFRDICYLELQPDNIVMVNLRDSNIKLVDFGSARFIPKAGAKTSLKGCTEYLAPEILKNEEVSSLTDVWCVGVLTYILLSGSSPFLGKDEEETRDNVTYVRYHFDNLHPDVTSEVTRFLMNIFKQCPIKRLTVNECLEHKWLSSSEYMIMKRESARFLPDKLAAFAKKFHKQRYEAMDPEMLTSLGMSSTKQELIIDF